jgi:hypothetical protein
MASKRTRASDMHLPISASRAPIRNLQMNTW